MKRLVLGLMATVVVLFSTGCTPGQAAAWRQWYRSDPAEAEAFLSTDTFAELSQSATVTAQAERLDPPPAPAADDTPDPVSSGGSSASSGGRCVGYEGMLAQYSPGWDVQKMSRIMYRESRCNPGAANSAGATGLLQVLRSHCGWLAPRVGPCNLTSASYNIRAGAELFRNGGYAHWAATR